MDRFKTPFRIETKEGSLIVVSIGEIVSPRSPFITKSKIYPVGFESLRSFFDITNPQNVTKYKNEILDFGDRPIFCVTPLSYPEERVFGLAPNECWQHIAERISKVSEGATVIKVINGSDMFGLTYLNEILNEMVLEEYKSFIRDTSHIPTVTQQKQKRKRKLNPKYLPTPEKKRKKESDSDFDVEETVEFEETVYQGNQGREYYEPMRKTRHFSDYEEVDVYGIFTNLFDFISSRQNG